jgi:hypothetical protein
MEFVDRDAEPQRGISGGGPGRLVPHSSSPSLSQLSQFNAIILTTRGAVVKGFLLELSEMLEG